MAPKIKITKRTQFAEQRPLPGGSGPGEVGAQSGSINARARLANWGLIAATAVFLLALGVVAFSRAAGALLITTDPLEHAQAVAVFSGGLPFRAMEAAEIYRQGWASEVWITHSALHAEDVALQQMGIERTTEDAYDRMVLEKLGVPAECIRVLDPRIVNTADEVRVIADALRKQRGDRVILVSSKYHSRRVKFLWRKLVGEHPQAIVRYARDDPFDPSQWWHTSRDALAVSREVLGLANAWAGFPVRSE